MTIKLNRLFFICISFFGIVLGGSQAVKNLGLDNLIKYASYFSLILCIMRSLLKCDRHIIFSRMNFFLIITFFFVIGIMFQDLNLLKKLYLAFSMVIISILGTLPINLIDSLRDFRRISYYLFYGVIISIFLGIICKVTMLTVAVEGIGLGYGFNGGMLHKNFFAITVFISYSLLFLHQKYIKYNQIDTFVLFLEFFFIIASNTRTVYLILLVFWGIVNIDILLKIKKEQRYILFFLVSLIGVIFVIDFWDYLVDHSSSYSVRVQGIINFLNYYHGDYFHLILGDATLGFGDSSHDYGYNVRSVTGWNGTLEMPLLSVMIKNGFIGLIGYILIIWSFIKTIRKIQDKTLKIISLSILIPLLMSATVENYIVNINFVFMPVCFCILNSLNSIKERNQ